MHSSPPPTVGATRDLSVTRSSLDPHPLLRRTLVKDEDLTLPTEHARSIVDNGGGLYTAASAEDEVRESLLQLVYAVNPATANAEAVVRRVICALKARERTNADLHRRTAPVW